ncbi:hypothetical protein [Herbidospora mongoliensis]|uniref:hypothetical protein n=1 Tax=Herbidospora mongoliensis TaxID=688067 RepID=UPI00082DDF1B|nr:hypothetical protein [Herbidospora mongoliensis]
MADLILGALDGDDTAAQRDGHAPLPTGPGRNDALAAVARVRAFAESWAAKPDEDWANEMTGADAGRRVLAALEGREPWPSPNSSPPPAWPPTRS